MSYESDRAELQKAQETIEKLYAPTLKQAAARGDAYILHYNRFGVRSEQPFLTLAEALEEAEGDMQPLYIVAPDGVELDPHDGAPSSGLSEKFGS